MYLRCSILTSYSLRNLDFARNINYLGPQGSSYDSFPHSYIPPQGLNAGEAPPPPAFSPSDLSPTWWLPYTGIVEADSGVSQWTDASGNANHLVRRSTSNDPNVGTENSNDTVDVSGGTADKFLEIDGIPAELIDMFDGGGELTFLIDIISDGESNRGALVATTTDEDVIGSTGFIFQTRDESGSNLDLRLLYNFSVTNSDWRWTVPLGKHVVSLKYDSSSDSNRPELRIDNSLITRTDTVNPSGTATSNSGNDITLGTLALIRQADCQYGEIVLTDELSTGDRLDLYTYLAAIWGI